MELSEINTESREGKLLMAALAIITTESRTDQTPFQVLDDVKKLSEEMFKDDDVIVTPEWAAENGFEQTTQHMEGIYMLSSNLYFKEKDFDRQMFALEFTPIDSEDGHHVEIYIQEDAGMDYKCIPQRWWVLSVEYLNSIYYGVRGKYLTKKA